MSSLINFLNVAQYYFFGLIVWKLIFAQRFLSQVRVHQKEFKDYLTMVTMQTIHCPHCGKLALRQRYGSVSHTQCPHCDYVLTMCDRTGRVLEAYTPEITHVGQYGANLTCTIERTRALC